VALELRIRCYPLPESAEAHSGGCAEARGAEAHAGGFGGVWAGGDLCGLLVMGGDGEGWGLQRLKFCWMMKVAFVKSMRREGDLLDVERGWIECGLATLGSVKSLRIDVESGFLGGARLGSFGEDLRETMPWIERLEIGVTEAAGKDAIEEGDSGIGLKTLN
jgi:hypothetical protein